MFDKILYSEFPEGNELAQPDPQQSEPLISVAARAASRIERSVSTSLVRSRLLRARVGRTRAQLSICPATPFTKDGSI
jgi:hypothetical protein